MIIKYKYNVLNSIGVQESWTGSFTTVEKAKEWYNKYGKEWEEQGRRLVFVEFEAEAPKTEEELIFIAECEEDDKKAKRAMNELRKRFDKSYGWCADCDGMVVKDNECCLNKFKL